MSEKVYDIVIVGAGISGVYSGWRLITADPDISPVLKGLADCHPGEKLSIGLFEYSKRIGGRLLTVTPPGMPDTRCELGGMRYITTQPLIRSLVEDELKLKYQTFFVSEPENIAYVRGKRLRVRDLNEPDKIPYNLSWWERNTDLASLLVAVVEQIVPGGSKMSARELGQIKVEGKYLWQWGFWNLLRKVLSNEAYIYLNDSSGYYSPTENWNAADAIPGNVGDFGAAIEYRRVSDGYEVVPQILAEKFQQSGGEIYLEHPLHSFDETTLPDGSKGIELHFDGANSKVLARNLILAMPRRSLELIQQAGRFFEDSEVQELIRSVTPSPFFKMFVCYRYPWWQWAYHNGNTGEITKGESITDIPIRQCYYWEVDQKNDNSVLLATYDDRRMVSFWRGLQTEETYDENYEGLKIPVDLGDSDLKKWQEHAAPEAMVEEIHRQLLELHGLNYAPKPYAAAYMDWSSGLYGGGVNFWDIHVKSWEIIERMTQPLPDMPVHICGSAYSNFQGWVEGALDTAEMMLEKHFGLSWPTWAPARDDTKLRSPAAASS